MKYFLSAVVLAALLVAPGLAAEPQSTIKAEIDVGFFYDRLSPHGQWVKADTYGWIWRPAEVSADWRPYSDGRWVYCEDCGWCFASDAEWGWAAYHYGRWAVIDTRWAWIPGNEWAGAWVVWRSGGEHIGWAALPPAAKWETGSGLKASSVKFETEIPEPAWVFVSRVSFSSPKLKSVLIEADEVKVAIGRTSVAGSLTLSGEKILNTAITAKDIESATGKEVKRLKLRPVESLGILLLRVDATDEERVFSPKVIAGGNATPPEAKDTERIAAAAAKTLKEKHQAESRVLDDKHATARKDNPDAENIARMQEIERADLTKRQKEELDDCEKRYRKNSVKESPKEPKDGSGSDPGGRNRDNPSKDPDNDKGKKN